MPLRALMVAYHYPPAGGVAAQRPAQFARYLPDFGWTPCVLARRPDPAQPLDPSLVPVAPPPLARLGPLEPARALRLLPAGLRDPLRRLLFLPGPELGWAAALAAALTRWIERLRPDVLYASSVPEGSLVAAAWAARRARIPFVPDFHNEWTRNPYYRPPTPLHDAAHRALEARVVRSAAAVVTLNPLHTDDLRARFGARAETVENGFDPADVAVAARPKGRRPLVFTYAGAVYGHQDPTPFLRAAADAGVKDLEVRVVGDRFSAFRPGTWPFPVEVRGHVPHAELGRIYSEADAFFLCLSAPAARQLPAKLYEYLHAGRPVFAVVPRDGAAERFVRQRGCGACADVADPSAWGPALRRFVESLDDYRPPAAPDLERRALAGRLAAVLDAAVGGRR